MNIKKRNIVSRLLAYILLLEFSLIIANNVFFIHIHTLPDGPKIIHAHPYHKNNNLPGKQHHHSNFELVILAQIGTYTVQEFEENIPVFNSSFLLLSIPGITGYLSCISSATGQRAPPFV